MNAASWTILGIIILIVVIVIYFLVKNRHKGCCGCNKESCPYKKKMK